MASGDIKVYKENVGGTFDEYTLPAIPVKATGAELNTGTDDAKFATAKALDDGEFVGIHVGTSAPADTTKLWLDTN
jgi:hypothetical protein